MLGAGAPPVEHPMLAALDAVAAGLSDLAAVSCWSLSDDGVRLALDEITAGEARLAAVKLAVVAEADRTVKLAAALHGPAQMTGRELAAGRISAAHARVIVTALAALPPVDADVRVRAEKFLIGQAAVLDPLLLARAGRALVETLTTQPDADARTLAQQAARELHRTVAADGMVRWAGWFDPEADALLELARLGVAAGTLPDSGGLRPTLTVTIDHDVLVGRIAGIGHLGTGEPVDAETARRIGCDARIIPVVLGGAGQVLDVGRATRTIPPALRHALNVRDDGCAFSGCDAQKAWCDGHHIIHWAGGGRTAIDNLVLLCAPHHAAVHHDGWTVTIDDDSLPTLRPPPWIDPDQTPRRHHRNALRQLLFGPTSEDPP